MKSLEEALAGFLGTHNKSQPMSKISQEETGKGKGKEKAVNINNDDSSYYSPFTQNIDDESSNIEEMRPRDILIEVQGMCYFISKHLEKLFKDL